MSRCVLLLLFVLFGAPQEDVQRSVRELLRKLRSDQVEERAEAQKKLQEIGAPAILELAKAVQDSDADYAARAAALLKAISLDADAMHNPGAPVLLRPAPDRFKIRYTTSAGDFTVKVVRAWAPNGADRLHGLVRIGYFTDCRFFRVVSGFMCQFGIHGDPGVSVKWKGAVIPDDPVKESNKEGRVTFAMRGPRTRTTQLFVNLKDNAFLDDQGFAPVGEIVDGMDVVRRIYADYGEGAPQGKGPDQVKILSGGNAYLADFPKLDFIRKAEIVD